MLRVDPCNARDSLARNGSSPQPVARESKIEEVLQRHKALMESEKAQQAMEANEDFAALAEQL